MYLPALFSLTLSLIATSVAASTASAEAGDGLLNIMRATRRQAGKSPSQFATHLGTRDLTDALNNATGVATPSIIDSSTISILDSTGEFSLAYDASGNFYLDLASMRDTYQFTVLDGKVYGGNGDNVMFYYPDELAATGVSRFRQGDLGKVPVGSKMINLMPFGTGQPYLMPIAPSDSKVLTPIYCTYKGVGSRIFLTENIETGIAALMDEANQVVITGGVVTWCGVVAFPSEMPSL